MPILTVWIGVCACTALAQDAFSPNVEISGTARKSDVELDLSSVWDRTDLSSVNVMYSAVGWEPQATAAGNTVTLQLLPVDGSSAAVNVAEGLEGRDVYVWTPANVEQKQYELRHQVVKGSSIDAKSLLTARFSFENCEMRASESQIRAAVLGIGQSCTITSDKDHPWQPIAGAGSGIASPTGHDSSFAVSFTGEGSLHFEWALDQGTASVALDGSLVKTCTVSADWQSEAVTPTGNGEHSVVFAVSDDSGPFRLRNVRWVTSDVFCRKAVSTSVRVDLRQGIRTLNDRTELLPFTYSSTNFVGITGSPSETIARVSVVRLTGEGDDVSQWTEEVPKTYRELKCDQGEGVVVWSGKAGVWKATFDIIAEGGESVHTEVAVFDMRKCIRGFCILLK